MPVTVVVRSASAPSSPSLTFDGPRIALGRGGGCDVRLPDPSVSLRHASIRVTGKDYAIVDEGSTNGTYVGGVRLSPHTPRIIRTGDLVRVGRVWLEIEVGHKAPTPDLGLATRDLALALVRDAMNAVGDDTVAKVRIAEGPDLGFELQLVDEGRAYVVGRAERCDIPLADEDASREHATIVRRGAQILLRDMGSRNGVWLGDQRLTPDRDVVWKPPTMARIGVTVLALDEPVSVALAALEAAVDEPLPEAEAPPPPPSLAELASAAPVSATPASAEAGAQSRIDVGAAPIADVPAEIGPASRAAPRRRRAWTITDIVVVTIAILVIGASVAGLVWVLR